MLTRHYLDELGYLRDLGRDFAKTHPEIAGHLADAGTDPDVERLLEGTAFIGARIRQKLDDELPELTHALIECFWPQWLCPLPASVVVQATPARPEDRDRHHVPRGTTVASVPVQGVRCRFRTAMAADVLPVRIERVELRLGAGAELRVGMVLPEGLTAAVAGIDRLRLHCNGPFSLAAALHRLLTRHVSAVLVEDDKGMRRPLRDAALHPVPFNRNEPLFAAPGAAFPAHLALQEYFACPQRSLFADLTGLGGIAALGAVRRWTLCLQLADPPQGLPQVDAGNLLLGCTVAVNLFEHDADPLSILPERREYRLRPAGLDTRAAEVHSVLTATGLVRGRPRPRPWFLHHQAGRDASAAGHGTFLVRRRTAVVEQGHDSWFEVTSPHAESDEVVSARLLCTNRRLGDGLAPGEIDLLGADAPTGIRLRNIAKPTPGCPADIGAGQEWRVVAQLAGNLAGLGDVEAVRRLLELHHPRAHADQLARSALRRLVDALESFTVRPATRVVQGVPLRGLDAELLVRDDRLDGFGELHLVAVLLDGVLAEHAALNCFTRLTVRGVVTGDVLSLPPRAGAAVLR